MIYLTLPKREEIIKTSIDNNYTQTIKISIKKYKGIKEKNYKGTMLIYYEYLIKVIDHPYYKLWNNTPCLFDAPPELHDIMIDYLDDNIFNLNIKLLPSNGKLINNYSDSSFEKNEGENQNSNLFKSVHKIRKYIDTYLTNIKTFSEERVIQEIKEYLKFFPEMENEIIGPMTIKEYIDISVDEESRKDALNEVIKKLLIKDNSYILNE